MQVLEKASHAVAAVEDGVTHMRYAMTAVFARERMVYVKRLEKLVRRQSGFLHCNPRWHEEKMRRWDDLFLFLYGLPIQVQVELGVKAAKRCLTAFRFLYPEDQRPQQVLEALEVWFQNREQGVELLRRCEMGDLFTPREYARFLHAIDYLRKVVLLWSDDRFRSAAAIADVVGECAEQGSEEAWRGDDPEAWWSVKRANEALEITACSDLSDEEEERLEEEWDRLMEVEVDLERSDFGNVAAWAVARREWYVVSEWLREIAEKYPIAEKPTRWERKVWGHNLWMFPDPRPGE